jgi:hypothetical protein
MIGFMRIKLVNRWIVKLAVKLVHGFGIWKDMKIFGQPTGMGRGGFLSQRFVQMTVIVPVLQIIRVQRPGRLLLMIVLKLLPLPLPHYVRAGVIMNVNW